MTTKIIGFVSDTSDDYKKHKEILLMCIKHSVSMPSETQKYFGSNYAYIELLDEKLEFKLNFNEHYDEYSADMQHGFEVNLTKLPKKITRLRFYNDY